jgi:hypothetical protein
MDDADILRLLDLMKEAKLTGEIRIIFHQGGIRTIVPMKKLKWSDLK